MLMALPGMVWAAKPGYIHVNESVEINAPPAKVWSLVKNWNGLAQVASGVLEYRNQIGHEQQSRRGAYVDNG
jgi:hypothetical protein